MINQNYYQNHIKKFPEQFAEGIKRASNIDFPKNLMGISICGVGGSALYGELLNNIFQSDYRISLNIEIIRSYTLPTPPRKDVLYIVSSYSGNTEETISCLNEIMKLNLPLCIFTSGGKLLQIAKEKNLPLYEIPAGIQPRLSTGYFVAGVISIAEKLSLIPTYQQELFRIAEQLEKNLKEDEAKILASQLKNKIPIIYTSNNISSIARIAKIKFNENCKIQSF